MKEKKTKEAPQKEHKPNWKEVYATAADIRQMLSDNVMLRQNVISGRTEFRVPMKDEFDTIGRMYYPSGASPLDEWRSAVVWHPVSDRFVNSLWSVFSDFKEVRLKDISTVINSDFVPLFNPLQQYLESLPPPDKDKAAIFQLAMSVSVKGGIEEQTRFYLYLRKWLVGMVAGWLEDDVVNQVILVLVGRQGIYKTTWFNHLLPPALQPYFHSNTNFGNMSKDEVLKLSQYGLICCEELDTMKPAEMNRLKWAVTTTVTDERRPYAHYSERRKHVASYCGTGNNIQFIDDSTGTRRWLPFEVDGILSPRENPFDYEGIYSQAYALYQQGFQFWFDQTDIQRLAVHNRQFETPQIEQELVDVFFRRPNDKESGEYMPVSRAMQIIGGSITQHLNASRLGQAFTSQGFEFKRTSHSRGYIVVQRDGAQIKERLKQLAIDDETF